MIGGKNDISSCDILSKSCFSYLYTCTSLIRKKYVNLKYMFTCNLNIARLHYMEISVRSTFQIAGIDAHVYSLRRYSRPILWTNSAGSERIHRLHIKNIIISCHYISFFEKHTVCGHGRILKNNDIWPNIKIWTGITMSCMVLFRFTM